LATYLRESVTTIHFQLALSERFISRSASHLHLHLHLFRSKSSRITQSKTSEHDNQAHNMLSQLPAITNRKVKQQ